MAEQYGKSYMTVQQEVTAIQLKISTITDVYYFMNKSDVTFKIAHGDISAIVLDKNGTRLNVNKFDWIVRDSDSNITIWKDADFKKKFVEKIIKEN